jgi:hypothetical protein
MNALFPVVKRITTAEFLLWVDTQDQGKFECDAGEQPRR